ncbi:MAG TPA: hypothetical protein VMF30_16145, partial [Pirellulales bacterium]|nr:hypothetical protein [Pirellulales bacterium]
MSPIASCPRCAQQVTIPGGAESTATVRCPLCGAEYLLAEALAKAPPALIVVGGLPATPPPTPTAGDSDLHFSLEGEPTFGGAPEASGIGLAAAAFAPHEAAPPLGFVDDTQEMPVAPQEPAAESLIAGHDSSAEHSFPAEHTLGDEHGNTPEFPAHSPHEPAAVDDGLSFSEELFGEPAPAEHGTPVEPHAAESQERDWFSSEAEASLPGEPGPGFDH